MRQVFAAKSEILSSEQKDLFFNEAEALASTPLLGEFAIEDSVQVSTHRRAKHGRKPLDSVLPYEGNRDELPEAECMMFFLRGYRPYGIQVYRPCDICSMSAQVSAPP